MISGTSVLGSGGDLRTYEAVTLRPYWDNISTEAAKAASVLNWESAPAASWNRERAGTYVGMVHQWGARVAEFLQANDPDGTSASLELTSLRRGYEFHVNKIVHLRDIGISGITVPSDFQATMQGVKAAGADLLNFGAAPFGVSWGTIAVGGLGLLAALAWRRS